LSGGKRDTEVMQLYKHIENSVEKKSMNRLLLNIAIKYFLLLNIFSFP